jgi:hypothetical protein
VSSRKGRNIKQDIFETLTGVATMGEGFEKTLRDLKK